MIVKLQTWQRLVCSSNQHMCLVIYKLIDMFWCKHSLGTLQLLRHWGSIRDDQWSRFPAVKQPSHFLPPPHLHCTHCSSSYFKFKFYKTHLDFHLFICFPISDAAATVADRWPGAGCLSAASRSRGERLHAVWMSERSVSYSIIFYRILSSHHFSP